MLKWVVSPRTSTDLASAGCCESDNVETGRTSADGISCNILNERCVEEKPEAGGDVEKSFNHVDGLGQAEVSLKRSSSLSSLCNNRRDSAANRHWSVVPEDVEFSKDLNVVANVGEIFIIKKEFHLLFTVTVTNFIVSTLCLCQLVTAFRFCFIRTDLVSCLFFLEGCLLFCVLPM